MAGSVKLAGFNDARLLNGKIPLRRLSHGIRISSEINQLSQCHELKLKEKNQAASVSLPERRRLCNRDPLTESFPCHSVNGENDCRSVRKAAKIFGAPWTLEESHNIHIIVGRPFQVDF